MKFFVIMMTTVVLILLLSWIIMLPLSFKDQECTAKNGILVKTVDGYFCLDRKVVIKM
jgi:hypothetical protein